MNPDEESENSRPEESNTTLNNETQEYINDVQPVLNELSARVHYIRARDYTRRENLEFAGLIEVTERGPVTVDSLKYITRLIYVRLLTDLDWIPPPGSLVLVGTAIESIKEFARCETCRLPAGVWCFPEFDV